MWELTVTVSTYQDLSRPAAMARSTRLVGLSAILLAVAFNTPFSLLGWMFDYPGVLRRPAGEVLDLFAAGGPGLILTWHAFMLCALALALLAPLLAVTPERLLHRPALAVGAALTGALAGLAQAIGLSRWVFAVPELARAHADSAASETARFAAERSFELLNAWGGVAIGEHIGQLLTAVFVLQTALLQNAERHRGRAVVGGLTAILLLVGVQEGLALAVGASGELFGLITVVGYLAFTLWLIWTGVGLMIGRKR